MIWFLIGLYDYGRFFSLAGADSGTVPKGRLAILSLQAGTQCSLAAFLAFLAGLSLAFVGLGNNQLAARTYHIVLHVVGLLEVLDAHTVFLGDVVKVVAFLNAVLLSLGNLLFLFPILAIPLVVISCILFLIAGVLLHVLVLFGITTRIVLRLFGGFTRFALTAVAVVA